jgi:flagellar motor switch protein FliM
VSDILSQAEIDALLSAMQSGEVDVEAVRQEESVKKIKVYDFRRPNKFSKDQLNTITIIYDNFCRQLTTLLSGMLRMRVISKVVAVDQVTYEEFVRSIPNPTIVNMFTFPPLTGRGILEMNPSVGFSIIDRLFGGPGIGSNQGRDLTEIEDTILERVAERVLYLFKDAWASILDANAVFDSLETNPQFVQLVSPTEMVIVVTVNVTIGDTEGFINLCIPCLMLESISVKLTSKFLFSVSASASSDDYRQHLQHVIETARIPLSVIVGKNSISIGDMLELQMGDVIPLVQKKEEDASIFVGKTLKYFGKLGLMGNKLAVQITQELEEGSETD